MRDFEVFNTVWDWKEFRAQTHKDAALKASVYLNETCDYRLSQGGEGFFAVRSKRGNRAIKFYKGSARITIQYQTDFVSVVDMDKYELWALHEALKAEGVMLETML